MTVEEILRGEAKNVEFKEMLPRNSEKYTKTVVAYANTQGGRLLFGVADGTREIVGIEEAVLFQTMDRIAEPLPKASAGGQLPDSERGAGEIRSGQGRSAGKISERHR